MVTTESSGDLQCVSPVIDVFMRRWNSDMSDDDRQMLEPYRTRAIGTATGEADDRRRACLVMDWLLREYLPAWLRAAGLNERADAIAALPPMVDPAFWGPNELSRSVRYAVSTTAKAAWAATRDASQAARAGADWTAVRAIADVNAAAFQATALYAAWDASGAISDAASRCRVSVCDGAMRAARAVSWTAAASVPRGSARTAVKRALAPTVRGIQQSALSLLDRMIGGLS